MGRPELTAQFEVWASRGVVQWHNCISDFPNLATSFQIPSVIFALQTLPLGFRLTF